jgi:hypothetical protein
MNEALKKRILRRMEGLPEAQLYQVLDYLEFLESRYNRKVPDEVSPLQKMAESLDDSLRRGRMNPSNLREAFQLISTADKILASVSEAGRQFLDDLQPPPHAPSHRSASGSRRDGGAGGDHGEPPFPSDRGDRTP